MGKIHNNSTSGVTGKVGNVVYYEMWGKTYSRTLPSGYHDARSEEQKKVRTHFVAVNVFQRSMIDTAFHAIWKIAAQGEGMSGANFFVKSNSAAFGAEGEIVDFSKIHLSAGRLALPDRMTCVTDGEGVTTLVWANGFDRFSPRYFDRLCVGVLYEDAPFEAALVDGVQAFRHENRATFRVPRREGVRAHLYCFFASDGDDAFSNDWYVQLQNQ